MNQIGLALGGGGAKGFAHIPVLEVFDELGVKPACISGTSIGAILGAFYASGRTAREIAEMIFQLIVTPQKAPWKHLFRNPDHSRFFELIDPHFSLKPKGLIKGEKLLGFLYEQIGVETFEELNIPLKVIATDFWRNTQVVFESGPLLPALRASMALPYLFTPVTIGDRVLVDGGLVNIVPHDTLSERCDLTIAVDVMGESSKPKNKSPNPIEAIFHAYEVMMIAMAEEKLRAHPVDVYLRSPLMDIELLDFHKVESIYNQGLAIKGEFKPTLARLIQHDPTVSGRFRRT